MTIIGHGTRISFVDRDPLFMNWPVYGYLFKGIYLMTIIVHDTKFVMIDNDIFLMKWNENPSRCLNWLMREVSKIKEIW